MSVSVRPARSTAETIGRLARTAPPPAELGINIRLATQLAVTSFKLRYSGSALGYVWSLMRPVLVFGMLYVVFAAFLLRGRTAPGENFPVELLVGIVGWTFFAEATMTATSAVVANTDMLHRARFSRWVLVVAAVGSASITLAVNVALLMAVGFAFHWFTIGVQTLWVPLLLLELGALAVGLGLALGAFYVSYRDLAYVWEIALQFLFYASAIVFPLSLVPSRFRTWVFLNPLAQITQDLRRALVSETLPWTSSILGFKLAVPLAAVALSVFAGIMIFRQLSPRFGEWV